MVLQLNMSTSNREIINKYKTKGIVKRNSKFSVFFKILLRFQGNSRCVAQHVHSSCECVNIKIHSLKIKRTILMHLLRKF